ncbi:hypothetical protein PtB15_11B397 [Puccinia triticina]|nr:hypothetical protein PtB15_11B397 [Puccinia triticina]
MALNRAPNHPVHTTSLYKPLEEYNKRTPTKPRFRIFVSYQGRHPRVKLGNTNSPSDSPSPSVSPAKRTFIQMTPEAGGSDSKGKQKASPKEFLKEEHGVEDEPQSEPAEEEDDDNCPKTGRGRPRKAILKDAAKRLKKL